jgi:hypothetical protein
MTNIPLSYVAVVGCRAAHNLVDCSKKDAPRDDHRDESFQVAAKSVILVVYRLLVVMAAPLRSSFPGVWCNGTDSH